MSFAFHLLSRTKGVGTGRRKERTKRTKRERMKGESNKIQSRLSAAVFGRCSISSFAPNGFAWLVSSRYSPSGPKK